MNTKQLQQMEKLVPQADRAFETLYRELLASFDMREVGDGVRAFSRLHKRAEILAQESPTFDYFLGLLETSFITLYDREALNPIADITVLGKKALDQMRVKTGINVESLPAPAPTPLTPAQALESEIRSAWRSLSGDQIRKKRANNRAYREAFERIAPTLDSQVTALSRIEGIGG
jgi:hypothetical protein